MRKGALSVLRASQEQLIIKQLSGTIDYQTIV